MSSAITALTSYKINKSVTTVRMDFKYLCHFSMKELYEMQIHIDILKTISTYAGLPRIHVSLYMFSCLAICSQSRKFHIATYRSTGNVCHWQSHQWELLWGKSGVGYCPPTLTVGFQKFVSVKRCQLLWISNWNTTGLPHESFNSGFNDNSIWYCLLSGYTLPNDM